MLLFVFRDLWKEMGDSNFQLFAELRVPPQAAGVVGTINGVFYMLYCALRSLFGHLELASPQ